MVRDITNWVWIFIVDFRVVRQEKFVKHHHFETKCILCVSCRGRKAGALLQVFKNKREIVIAIPLPLWCVYISLQPMWFLQLRPSFIALKHELLHAFWFFWQNVSLFASKIYVIYTCTWTNFNFSIRYEKYTVINNSIFVRIAISLG